MKLSTLTVFCLGPNERWAASRSGTRNSNPARREPRCTLEILPKIHVISGKKKGQSRKRLFRREKRRNKSQSRSQRSPRVRLVLPQETKKVKSSEDRKSQSKKPSERAERKSSKKPIGSTEAPPKDHRLPLIPPETREGPGVAAQPVYPSEDLAFHLKLKDSRSSKSNSPPRTSPPKKQWVEPSEPVSILNQSRKAPATEAFKEQVYKREVRIPAELTPHPFDTSQHISKIQAPISPLPEPRSNHGGEVVDIKSLLEKRFTLESELKQ